tara:strand:- start:10472 stop:11827 length:1356 start_codon:yes stop_codon:yes gene_type:complete
MRKILSGYSKELISGVASVVSLRVLGVLIGYLFVLVVARLFGATSLGEYQLTVHIVATFALFSALGFNQLTLKYGSRYARSGKMSTQFRNVAMKWFGVAISASIIASSLLALFSESVANYFFSGEGARKYILLASLLVPLQVFNNLACELFRGLGLIALSEYLRSIHVRAANIIFLTVFFVYANDMKDVYLVVASFMAATFTAFLFAVVVFLIKVKKTSDNVYYVGQDNRLTDLSLKRSLQQALPMYQSSLLVFASTQALVFILAYFENPAEVAKYNVALQLASLANFIFASVVTVSAPMYSRDYSGDFKKLNRTIRESSRMIFWTSGSVSLLIALFSYPILFIFGDAFAEAWPVLVILAVANFVNAFTGASGSLLDMTGGHRVRKNILFINAVLTLFIAFYAIESLGVFGAALAYFFNMCFGNFIGVYIVYRRLGVNMIYFPGQKVVSRD